MNTEFPDCPLCGRQVSALFFLGVQFDGYCCTPCKRVWFGNDPGEAAARMKAGQGSITIFA